MGPKKRLRCCVVDCTNTSFNSPETSFYSFPIAQIYKYKQQRRDKWIQAVRRQNPDGSAWEPSKNSRICSQHFVGNRKSEHPLHPGYNPSIFPKVYRKTTTSMTATTARYKRAVQRKRITETNVAGFNRHEELSLKERDHTAIGVDVFNKIEHRAKIQSVKVDQETQVNFMDEDCIGADINCGTFTCNRYIYLNSCKTSDVKIQVYIPDFSERTLLPAKKKKKTVHIGCRNRIDYRDKAVGQEICDTDSEGLLNCTTGFHGIYSIKNNQQMLDLAGVTRHSFKLLMKFLAQMKDTKVSRDNRLLIFLIRMKCGLTFSALSVLFAVHRSTASRIFHSILQYLASATKDFVFWPSRKVDCAMMPQVFKETYSNCRVIIDCTEFRVKQLLSIESRVRFYSHYKKGYTLKVLLGCTPSGAISFDPRCYGGQTTYAQITSSSEFFNLLEPHDLVLADKEFPRIKTKLDETGRGILLVMPPFSQNTFSAEEALETYKIATVRIHIKRIMQRITTYRILDELTSNMLPHSDNIVFVCCALVNL